MKSKKTTLKGRGLTDIENIKKLASKRGVIILLDGDTDSDDTRMGNIFVYSPKNKILTIVVNNIEASNYKPVVLDIIRKAFTSGGLILKQTSGSLLESYNDYLSEGNIDDQSILSFFNPVISRQDFQALKMSLFIRDQKNKGVNISKLKSDIRERFGERGSNIANLCSAGYFEYEFIPIYNQVSPEEFKNYYEIVVGERARALFVHKGMTSTDIENEFQDMLNKATKYHLKDFRIHGLGKQNVLLIKQFFAEKQEESKQPDDEVKYISRKELEMNTPFEVIEYEILIIQDNAHS